MPSLKCFHDDDNATSKDEILFPNLQELDIKYCTSLVSLPSNFPKLRSLKIDACNELRSLPDEIQSFKDINEITVYNCKILNKRYEREIGEDWPKISHIQHLDIYNYGSYDEDEHKKEDNGNDSVSFTDEDNDENEDKGNDSVYYTDEDIDEIEDKGVDSVNYRDED